MRLDIRRRVVPVVLKVGLVRIFLLTDGLLGGFHVWRKSHFAIPKLSQAEPPAKDDKPILLSTSMRRPETDESEGGSKEGGALKSRLSVRGHRTFRISAEPAKMCRRESIWKLASDVHGLPPRKKARQQLFLHSDRLEILPLPLDSKLIHWLKASTRMVVMLPA